MVGRALRARREHLEMLEMRGFSQPQAARTECSPYLHARNAIWETRPYLGCYVFDGFLAQ